MAGHRKSRASRIEELRADIDRGLAARDRAGAVETALGAVGSGSVDIPTLYLEILSPLLVETGACWQRDDTRIWQEHLVSSTVRTIVEALYPSVRQQSPKQDSAKTILLVCPEEEAHELGLRMVSDLLELAGWRTHFIGAATPSAEILDAARQLDVDVVGLSVSSHYNLMRVRDVVEELRTDLPDVSVWVGGAALARDRCGWSEDEAPDIRALIGVPDEDEKEMRSEPADAAAGSQDDGGEGGEG